MSLWFNFDEVYNSVGNLIFCDSPSVLVMLAEIAIGERVSSVQGEELPM